MLGVKHDSDRRHNKWELNLDRAGAPPDQDRWTGKQGNSGVSTRLSHSETRLVDNVKDEFQTCDSDPGESRSMTGLQKPLANALCNDSSKRGGLCRPFGPPTHASCVETRLISWTHYERSFLCELCPEVFLNSADLAEHSRTHINLPLFVCERCCITFFNETHFERHSEEHGVKQLHKCHLCPEEFDDELKLRVHFNVHVRESSCYDSGQAPLVDDAQLSNCFALQDNADVSRDEDISTAREFCHFCAQAFDCETSFKEHVRTKHSGELSISSLEDKKPSISQRFFDGVAVSAEAGEFAHESPYTTDSSLLKSFEDEAGLGNHLETHLRCDTQVQKAEPMSEGSTIETASSAEERVPRACHLCPEEFDGDAGLRRHILKEHSSGNKRARGKDAEKRFACEHCSKRFKLKGHLSRHLLTHTGETPFKCHLCPATFSQKGDLKRHLYRHAGYKRFPCPFCPKQFVVKADMETHRRTHTGERPFACDRCPASFSARDNLRKHINSHTGVRPHACDKCPRSFTRLADLKRHGRRHTGERPYSCTSCSKTFTRGNLLRDHFATAHGPS
ncbi:hypothetical protein V5799_030241 [Amblyomma americanum]|uniref:C2H2-type domain-containing protein n=1 Tax=Amblyomma americanum TaxID=6943 RepID=A0AAQ4ENU0_AMBAM